MASTLNGCVPVQPRRRGDQPIEQQQHERADDRGHEARALAGLVPAKLLAQPAGEQRARDAQQDGDDAPARIAPGHQHFGDARRRCRRSRSSQ